MSSLVIRCTVLCATIMCAATCGWSQTGSGSEKILEVAMKAKRYEFSPSTVEVAAGTKIVFKITALDREHGFEIVGVANSCVSIKKGETVTVEYLAEKPGTVEFDCCVYCGSGHRNMKGKIIVH